MSLSWKGTIVMQQFYLFLISGHIYIRHRSKECDRGWREEDRVNKKTIVCTIDLGRRGVNFQSTLHKNIYN